MLENGEVEGKQADFLLAEIDAKIATAKTDKIEVEPFSLSESIMKCMELRNIFGDEFVTKLSKDYKGVEDQRQPYDMIASKGSKGDYVYLVVRGDLIETKHSC